MPARRGILTVSARRLSHRHTRQTPIPPRQTRPRKRHNPNPHPRRSRNHQRKIPRLRHIHRPRSRRLPQSIRGKQKKRQLQRQNTPRKHPRRLPTNPRRTQQTRKNHNHSPTPRHNTQPLHRSRNPNPQSHRQTLRPTRPQHTQILPHTNGSTRRRPRLHRIHDGTHHKHLPRHQNERHRIPKRHIPIIRTKHPTKNQNNQNRRPQRNHARMGTQPRRNLNPRRPNQTKHDHNQPKPNRKPSALPAYNSSAGTNDKRNPRKQPAKHDKHKLGTK